MLGKISREQIEDLSALLVAPRDGSSDPGVTKLLNEIEVRVGVELVQIERRE
jgi:hypothetical protein